MEVFKSLFPMDVVRVQGRPYLFTNLRVKRETIPEDLHAYDVRDDCDGEFWEIKQYVFVNHWGTIIGLEPIDLKTHPSGGEEYWCKPEQDDEDRSSEGHYIASVRSEDDYRSRYDELKKEPTIFVCYDGSVVIEGPRHKVSLEYVGEGLSGDYNVDDPNDIPLMRFYVWYKPEQMGEWEEVEDASYCTRIPMNAPSSVKQNKAKAIWERYLDVIDDYPEISVKKLGEELSWISA